LIDVLDEALTEAVRAQRLPPVVTPGTPARKTRREAAVKDLHKANDPLKGLLESVLRMLSLFKEDLSRTSFVDVGSAEA
jgi:hypothetical protein